MIWLEIFCNINKSPRSFANITTKTAIMMYLFVIIITSLLLYVSPWQIHINKCHCHCQCHCHCHFHWIDDYDDADYDDDFFCSSYDDDDSVCRRLNIHHIHITGHPYPYKLEYCRMSSSIITLTGVRQTDRRSPQLVCWERFKTNHILLKPLINQAS